MQETLDEKTYLEMKKIAREAEERVNAENRRFFEKTNRIMGAPDIEKNEETTDGVDEKQNILDPLKSFSYNFMDSALFGFGDETAAALTALTAPVVAPKMGVKEYAEKPFSERYKEAKDILLKEEKEMMDKNFVSSLLGSLLGGFASGSAAGKTISSTLPSLATKMRASPILSGAASGGLSGLAYGIGEGEGDTEDIASSALTSALVGSALGGAVPAIGKGISRAKEAISHTASPVVERIKRIFSKPDGINIIPDEFLSGLTEKEKEKVGKEIIASLQKDFPHNWEEVLSKWKSSKDPMAMMGNKAVVDLAKKASRFPSGAEVAEDFFEKEIISSPERTTKTLPRDIYKSIDKIISEGQGRAKPLYEEAYKQNIELPENLSPEISRTINEAKKKFVDRLQGLPDNSVKVLDYAKRILRDKVESSYAAGRKNEGDYYKEVHDKLVNLITSKSPVYKKAVDLSHDYLSEKDAFKRGLEIMNTSIKTDDVSEILNKFSSGEKELFKKGALNAIRQKIETTRFDKSPYIDILGSKEKKEKLKLILDSDTYKSLEKALIDEDSLFKLRRRVLGSSPRSNIYHLSGLIEPEELASAISINPKAGAIFAMSRIAKEALKKSYDVRSFESEDLMAKYISQIMFEKNPSEKLKMINKISKFLGKEDSNKFLKAYFLTEQAFNNLLGRSAVFGRVGAELSKKPDQVDNEEEE